MWFNRATITALPRRDITSFVLGDAALWRNIVKPTTVITRRDLAIYPSGSFARVSKAYGLGCYYCIVLEFTRKIISVLAPYS